MSLIDRDVQIELVNVLACVPRINQLGSDKRDFLLEGLPQDSVYALKRDSHPRIDLMSMIEAAIKWGQLDSGEWAIQVIIQNALGLARGTQQGRELAGLLKKITEATGRTLSTEGKIRQHEVDFAIITALEVECQAVVGRLSEYRIETFEAADIRTYHRGKVPINNSGALYESVVVLLPSMGNEPCATAVGDVIRQFNPAYVLMVGIAGGIPQDDLELGDVVVADQVIMYEYTKETGEKSEPRYRVYPASSLLLDRVRSFWDVRWTREIGSQRPKGSERTASKVFVGPIATGNKVVSSHRFREQLVAQWPKLHAIEMESGGIAVAAWQRPQPLNWLVVRGISDWANPDKHHDQSEGWREYAADSAAAYVTAFLRSGPVAPLRSGSHDNM